MGRRWGPQPNGKWFEFSTIVDGFIQLDVPYEQVPQEWKDRIERRGMTSLDYTWEQACVWDRYIGGNAWERHDFWEAVNRGEMTFEEADIKINELAEEQEERYKSMTPEEVEEAILLHWKAGQKVDEEG